MCLPLIVIIAGLVIYPAFYSIYLSMLNKAQTRFIGLGNFSFLLSRDVFRMVVEQTAIFAISAVFFKALIGLITAHLINNLPAKGQRKWRGMLLVPWVIPLALSSLGWWWLFDPTHSAFNYILDSLGYQRSAVAQRSLLGALFRHPGQCLVRRAVLSDHVSGGAQIGAGAALRGRRDRRRQCLAEIHAHHAADDAQHHRHHGAVLADRHLCQFRHRADHDRAAARAT